LILSHGHDDHYGGLVDLLASRRDSLKRGLALYAGGDDTFCGRAAVAPNGDRIDYGQLDRGRLESLGLRVVVAAEPAVIAGHAVTTGRRERESPSVLPEPGRIMRFGSDEHCAPATSASRVGEPDLFLSKSHLCPRIPRRSADGHRAADRRTPKSCLAPLRHDFRVSL
jgi:7,8-dihydropterin-6-yl-methyl-4-(beta-D-ribofuranosyl)aminobenzene 5'-phosphate synthase